MNDPLFLIFLFILLSWTVARVTRFIVQDDLIEEPRDRILKWLYHHGRPHGEPMWQAPLWRRKLATLIDCPWCVSIWVSGFTMITVLWIVPALGFTDYSLPLPLFWWPAISMLAVNVIDRVDGEGNLAVRLTGKED